jgi:hypothetical protein
MNEKINLEKNLKTINDEVLIYWITNSKIIYKDFYFYEDRKCILLGFVDFYECQFQHSEQCDLHSSDYIVGRI